MQKTVVEFNDVSFNYYTKKLEIETLKNISFKINDNSFTSIVGPSGCGKTTILSLISGLLKASVGDITYQGEAKPPKNFFGYMFQRDQLFEWRTVWQNIILGLEIQKIKTKENLEYAENLLKKYGLFEFKDAKPSEISGGMRQRVALIRTLVLKPKLLLLDEPFSALDFQTRIAVQNDVYEIIKTEKIAAVLVTHDIEEAVSMSDNIIVLSKRPASIKQIIKLSPNEKETPFERRSKINIEDYVSIIWGDDNENEHSLKNKGENHEKKRK